MTSPKTRATRRCAARSCGQIEVIPSRRLAAAWLAWLGACVAVLSGGVEGGAVARALLGLVLIAGNLAAIRGAVLLRGARAVRMLEWDETGEFRLRSEGDTGSRPAQLRSVSFRLGIAFLVLWFATPDGYRVVLIDGGRQDPVAFRRLTRRLSRGMLLPSRPKV